MILSTLGERDSFDRRWRVLLSFSDRETDSRASWGSRVTINGFQESIFKLFSLRGRERFLKFDFMGIDGMIGGRISTMIVVDCLVYFDSLTKCEHFRCTADLRFINNNDPFYLD